MNVDRPEVAEIIDHADELARRSEDNTSAGDNHETVSPMTPGHGLDLDVGVRRSRSRSGLSRLSGPLGQRLRQHRRQVQEVAADHGLSNVRVFGSVARGVDTTGSDIDLLADVAPGVGLLGLARCQHELEALLDATVDLVPAGDLKSDVTHAVQAEVIPL